MKERIKHLILLIVLIGIDQITKYFVRADLMNKDPFVIIPKVLNLQYHENTGAVWGIMSDRIDFLRIFTLIILVVIIFLYFKIPDSKKYKILKLLAIFMIAGAIGNLIDRFLLGHVTDFIYFEIIDFPLFNFADSCLTVASIVLFILALFYYKDEDFAFLGKSFRGKKISDAESENTIQDENTLQDENTIQDENTFSTDKVNNDITVKDNITNSEDNKDR